MPKARSPVCRMQVGGDQLGAHDVLVAGNGDRREPLDHSAHLADQGHPARQRGPEDAQPPAPAHRHRVVGLGRRRDQARVGLAPRGDLGARDGSVVGPHSGADTGHGAARNPHGAADRREPGRHPGPAATAADGTADTSAPRPEPPKEEESKGNNDRTREEAEDRGQAEDTSKSRTETGRREGRKGGRARRAKRGRPPCGGAKRRHRAGPWRHYHRSRTSTVAPVRTCDSHSAVSNAQRTHARPCSALSSGTTNSAPSYMGIARFNL
jgi:hypothetical protein